MSYSSELKKTLKDISMKKKCCRKAFFYGESLATPENKQKIEVDWERYGYLPDEAKTSVKTENFKCQSCRAAFLRGIFCAVGTVSDPEKSFHFELKFKNEELADSIDAFMSDFVMKMKRTKRGEVHSLYLKKSDDIEDMIHYLGAGREAFQVANEKIKRDFANMANRRNNFEFGNIKKTVNAASESTNAIKLLIKKGKISNLPKGLAETAQLRVDNPYANLEELAELHSDRISKSGVNHRLQKLIELSKED
ncbi:MAG: DNA-binding protein WhiA [Clostridia bacterium]|nr:DNA-binding protein WhiA [Clostridia bacterium]